MEKNMGKGIGFGLLAIWTGIIGFYLVSLTEPAWLEGLSKKDITEKGRNFKAIGDQYLQNRKYPEAVRLYRNALKYLEDDPATIGNLAITYAQMGRYDQARKSLEYMLKNQTGEPGIVHRNLADIAIQTNDVEDAVFHYRQAASFGPNPIQSNLQLGMIYMEQENWVEAVKSLSLASYQRSSLRTFHDAVLITSQITYRDEPEISSKIDKLLNTRDNSHLERFDEQLFRRVLAQDRMYARTFSNLGIVYRAIGDNKNAKSNFEKALQIWPDLDQARNQYDRLLAEE